MTRSKIRTSGAEGLTLSSTSLTVANGLTLTDGDVAFADGHGLNFASASGDSSGMAAELLDDYEEGTFTPALAYATGGTTGIAYASGGQVGRYTKVGRVVSVYFRFALSDKGSGSGNAYISGLPYTVANVTHYPAAYGLHHDVNSGSGNSVANILPIMQLFNNTTTIYMYNSDSTTAVTADYFGNSSVVNGNVVYEV